MICSSAVHHKLVHQTDHVTALDMFSLQRLAEAQVLHRAVFSPCWAGQDGKECSGGLCSGDYAEFHSEGLTMNTHTDRFIRHPELLFKSKTTTETFHCNGKKCKC